jgi:hypothetical protein
MILLFHSLEKAITAYSFRPWSGQVSQLIILYCPDDEPLYV